MHKEPMRCCANLRCKSMYYRPDERPGLLHDSDTMPHYCLKTQAISGPDDKAARPSLCQPGRACYEAEESPASSPSTSV
jgi:hypothetical protein